jgi:hypothetical protein
MRYAGYARGLDHTDGEAAQAADVFGAIARGKQASNVLI